MFSDDVNKMTTRTPTNYHVTATRNGSTIDRIEPNKHWPPWNKLCQGKGRLDDEGC